MSIEAHACLPSAAEAKTGRPARTVFRDFTMLMVLGFVAMVIWGAGSPIFP